MKATCVAIIGIMAFSLNACVTGDEITNYIVESDGSIFFSIYRLNLTSDQTGEGADRDLADYFQKLEEKQNGPFTELMKANAQEVEVAVLRKASPASVLITGRIPSLNDFAAYLSTEDKDNSIVCTATSCERTRHLLCELTGKPSSEKAQLEIDTPPAYPSGEIRLTLAEGIFTNAQGFLLSNNKRSAILDEDALWKMRNPQTTSITLSLEWQIPEAP